MSTRRLSNATLASLPPGIGRPGYGRATLGTGIVHLGLGAFHRAHQAAHTDAVLAAGDRRWGITAASLRSPGARDALAPQDGLYTLNVRGEAERSPSSARSAASSWRQRTRQHSSPAWTAQATSGRYWSVPQPGAAAPHVADRDGRDAEAAAANPGDAG